MRQGLFLCDNATGGQGFEPRLSPFSGDRTACGVSCPLGAGAPYRGAPALFYERTSLSYYCAPATPEIMLITPNNVHNPPTTSISVRALPTPPNQRESEAVNGLVSKCEERESQTLYTPIIANNAPAKISQ
jgi:hypothetical protein